MACEWSLKMANVMALRNVGKKCSTSMMTRKSSSTLTVGQLIVRVMVVDILWRDLLRLQRGEG